jgi:L-iditol 2-dehydrogenase
MPRPGVLDVGDFPDPVLTRDGDVVVQMQYASVCGSDLHMLYDGLHREDQIGKAGYPGHEGVGVVVESRSTRCPVGAQVLTVPPGDMGGCFAELQLIDDEHLVPLPTGADLPRLLMAQQLGTTVFAAKKFCQQPGTTAAIIGAGSAGLFFLQLLRARGYETVLLSEPSAGRLAVAEGLGAVPVHVPTQSLADAVLDVTAGRGADLVIETAGLDACRAEAVEAVRRGGTVGCFGYPERVGLAPFPVQRAFRKAASVLWTSGAQAEQGLSSFREAVRLIDSGSVDADFCLHHRVGLEDAISGVELARAQGDVIKVIFDLRLDRPR